MFFINKKNEDTKRHLQSIIAIAQNIIDKSEMSGDFLHPIYRYINAIGSSVLQRLLMQYLLVKKSTM